MSRQRMPIMEDILGNRGVGLLKAGFDDGKYMALAVETKAEADLYIGVINAASDTDVVRINAQAASDIYWHGDKDTYDVKEFGSLNLPYPNMWMEWQVTGNVKFKNNEVVNLTPGWHSAAYVQELDVETETIGVDPHAKHAFMVTPFIRQLEHSITGLCINPQIVVSMDDLYRPISTRYLTMGGNWPSSDEVASRAADGFGAVCLAINLMHCRNVTVEDSGPIKYRQTTKEKRARAPRLEYKTITLPGGAYVSQPGKGEPGAAPLHRVRGHFKTYTAEAPLMGKHVGTYWWGWQVRGKSENGVRVSDYKLGVPS